MALRTRVDGEASVTFAVRVSPRASRSRIQGEQDGALKVALTAPPVDGAANQALVALLSKALGVPRRQVEITAGERSRTKSVRVIGVSPQAVRALCGEGQEPA